MLSTFIKLPISIKILVLSIFEWRLHRFYCRLIASGLYSGQKDWLLINWDKHFYIYTSAYSRVRYKKLFFLFLNKNICCVVSKEPSP